MFYYGIRCLISISFINPDRDCIGFFLKTFVLLQCEVIKADHGLMLFSTVWSTGIYYENKWLLLDHEEVFCLISSTLCSLVYYVVWRELSRCAGLRKLVVLCMHLRPFIIMSKLLWIFHGLSVLIVLWFLFFRKYSLLLYLNVVEIIFDLKNILKNMPFQTKYNLKYHITS